MSLPSFAQPQESWSSSVFTFAGLTSLFATLFSNAGGINLLVLGSLIEMGRRLCQWFFHRFQPQYSITAQFDEGDPAYEWIVLFLTQKQVWRRSRDFRVNAANSQRKWGVKPGAEVKGHADYVPTYQTPQVFRWNGYWVEIQRSKPANVFPAPMTPGMSQGGGTIYVTIYTLRMSVISELVEEAHQMYLEISRPNVTIYMADQVMRRLVHVPHFGPNFLWSSVKHKTRRPLNSIILKKGVVDALLQDAQEFIDSEDWYIEAGIPHRRGYLLYGPPGTGKTSTIYALAGELGLEIYTISLATHFVDDSFLARAVSSIPKHSILLIEDIDCAFPSREETEFFEEQATANMIPGMLPPRPSPFVTSAAARRSAVSMSGLLNVIDGVGSEEGRLFFATTNYVDRLDPALLRPGRIDKKFEYNHATQSQASALFERFFPENRFGDLVVDFSELSEAKVSTDTAPPTPPTEPCSLRTSVAEKDASCIAAAERSHIQRLATLFASQIPTNEFTTAELQGFLLSCKKQPVHAVQKVAEWVRAERDEREKKEEREKTRREKSKAKTDNMMKGYGTLWGQAMNHSSASPVAPVVGQPVTAEANGALPPVLPPTPVEASANDKKSNEAITGLLLSPVLREPSTK